MLGVRTTSLERRLMKIAVVLFAAAAMTALLGAHRATSAEGQGKGKLTEAERATDTNAERMLAEGKQTFRFDTFGDEAFWTDALQLNRAIAGANLGGVGPGVSPATALAVGLKVDLDALPGGLVAQLKHGRVNLNDPATTLALIKLDAVVGLKGTVTAAGNLQSIGITCALCHSTVRSEEHT